jgi:hypothetical protein
LALRLRWLMNSSNKNPATEIFDNGQKWVAPLIVIVAAVLAIWRNDVSVGLFPFALLAAAIYLAIVIAGSRIVRAIALKISRR